MLLRSLISALLLAAPALSYQGHIQGAFPELPLPTTSDQVWTAVASDGLWGSTATWLNGAGVSGVPGPGDVACIPSGVLVRIRSSVPATVALAPAPGSTEFWPGLRYVLVDGDLRFESDVDTELILDTLFVSPRGRLLVGEANERVQQDKTCRLTILPEVSTSSGTNAAHPINPAWDAGERSRGILAKGDVLIYGAQRQHVTVVPMDVVPKIGAPTPLCRVMDRWNWQDGDEVALAGTTFRRGTTASKPLTDERFALQILGSTGLAVDGDLTHDHLRARNPKTGAPFDLHLVHLERNVVIGSGWSTHFTEPMELAARGHFMFADGGDPNGPRSVDLEYVRFDEFGRTNKALPLDDVEVEITSVLGGCGNTNYRVTAAPGYAGSQYATPITNRRGRYAVHFHKNGHQLPGKTLKRVVGSVVTGTPGWGFVNHSSNVDFINCVCHDFTGSAFVTESGDEVGSFQGCVAMHGTGLIHTTPARGYVFKRAVFAEWKENGAPRAPSDPLFRPQPISDFGFGGDGFWLQGPMVRCVDNIANSCSGAGMFWLPTGAVNNYSPLDRGEKERYAGFPLARLADVYPSNVYTGLLAMTWSGQVGPRVWQWQGPNPEELVVLSDLPILECKGFQCYASLVGIHLRFSNESGQSFYNEQPFRYDCEVGVANFVPQVRPTQTMEDAQLWNNEQGFRGRYTDATDWRNITVANELAGYDDRVSRIGAELNHQVRNCGVHDVTIDGYGLGLLVQDRSRPFPNGADNSFQLTFSPGTFAEIGRCAIPSHMSGFASTEVGQLSLWPSSQNASCRVITEIDAASLTVTGQSAPYSVAWNAPPIPDVIATSPCVTSAPVQFPRRFLLRYREVDSSGTASERYRFHLHESTVGAQQQIAQISGLRTGKTYEIQVLANFGESTYPGLQFGQGGPLSLWSEVRTVTL